MRGLVFKYRPPNESGVSELPAPDLRHLAEGVQPNTRVRLDKSDLLRPRSIEGTQKGDDVAYNRASLWQEKDRLEQWLDRKLDERRALDRDAHEPGAHRIDPIEEAILISRKRRLAALRDQLRT